MVVRDPDMIHELEAALQARWDRETLAVYGDALAAAGDPRGELIAIDLEIDERGRLPDLVAQRRALIEAWLGDQWLSRPHWIRYGFVDDYRLVALGHRGISNPYNVGAAPARNFLRGLRIETGGALVEDLLRSLMARPFPWLDRLAVALVDSGHGGDIGELIARGAPGVTDLTLTGARLLATPAWPRLHTLRLSSYDCLIVRDSALPQVETLDLALGPFGKGIRSELVLALVNPRLFPGLTCLDLSRNEPTSAGSPAHNPFELALLFEDIANLPRLRLPSVRTDDDVIRVEMLLERHPTLAIEIARTYRHTRLDAVRDPRLRIAPARRWLPPDVAPAEWLLIRPIQRRVALRTIIDELETTYDRLHPHDRAPWDVLWDGLRGLGWADPDGTVEQLTFDAELLAAAFELLPEARDCAAAAEAIRLARPTTVTLQRDDRWG